MSQLFSTICYQPILNLLVFLYNIVPGSDIGIAIIVMTIVIRLALMPLSKKAIESQKSLQDLQPKIEEIKKQYAGNKEEMGRRMMALYAEHKINPLSSCLPLLIQFPFLFAVFKVFRTGLSNGSLALVYPFISRPEMINAVSLGFLDLSKPNMVLAVLAGLSQFWQAKMMMRKRPAVKSEGSKDEDMAATMNKQMLYMMPVLTVVFGASMPGGLTLYWLITTLLTIAQQKWIFGRLDKKKLEIGEKKIVEGEILK